MEYLGYFVLIRRSVSVCLYYYMYTAKMVFFPSLSFLPYTKVTPSLSHLTSSL